MRGITEKEIEKDKKNVWFDIVGAGKISLSKNANWVCGDFVGFSFGTSWSCGGVLDRDEALKLANFIYKTLK